MKKRFIMLFIMLCVSIILNSSVSAIVISSNNNGGAGSGSVGGAYGGTVWDGNGKIKAVRIRIFKSDNTEIANSYFLLSNTIDYCKSNASLNANVCETSGYDYSTVIMNTPSEANNNPSSCSQKTVKFGCLAADTLPDTFKLANSLWTYNGEILDNYFKSSSYRNLKEVLSVEMEYDSSNAQDGDFIIVEPATLVSCASVHYFGTSTALMMKNISYSKNKGYAPNVCSANDSRDGYTFQNLFNYMSTALKVSSSTKVYDFNKSNAAYTRNYTGYGYFKYNVSDMWDPEPTPEPAPEPVKYTLDLNYCVDGNIANDYYLPRYPTNFSYDFKLNGVNNDSTYFFNSISSGTSYEISNVVTSSHYEFKGYHISDSGRCSVNETSKSILRTITSHTSINLVFESTCSKRLADIKQSDGSYNASDLFDLYKFYLDKIGSERKDYRGLLNIANPTCTEGDVPSKEIKNLTCLSASTLSHANFNELNLSDYDEIIPGTGNSYAGFCLNSMYLKNNLGVQKFYSKSGQLLVKQLNDNSEIQIYNSSYNPVRVCGTDVATTTIRKMCYVLPDRVTGYEDYSSGDDVKLYFGDNNLDNQIDELKKTNVEVIKEGTSGIATSNALKLYEYEKEIKYKLNTIYLENISGKSINSGNKYLNGVLSKFNVTSGTIPFKITYRGKTYGEGKDLCQYETKPEIITSSNKLNLEFRIIDTKIPFNRKTMSNWSYNTDNSKDNETVKTYILNATNSYGIKNDEPNQPVMYKIKLTPTEIENIRAYNRSVPYDNYKVDCEVDASGNEVCMNTFLENLRDKKVIIYDDYGKAIKTLTNTEGLTFTNISSNVVDNSEGNLTLVNGVDITKKICTPVTSSTSGNVPTGKYNLGDEYKCEVAPEVEYNFYIVGTCGDDKINMIMSQNLETSGIPWISEANFYDKGGKTNDWIYENGGYKQNTQGPQTALNRLRELTSNWNNIVSYNYTLIDEIDDFKNNYKNNWANVHHPLSLDPDIEIYKPIEQNAVKARLLTRNEANNCGCARVFETCPNYLRVGVTSWANSTGYWLSNSFSYMDDLGNWFLTSANDMVADQGEESAVHRADINGIRPVITVYKSQISN